MNNELEVFREDLRASHPPARLLAINDASREVLQSEAGAKLICNVVENDPDNDCRFKAIHRLWNIIISWNTEFHDSTEGFRSAALLKQYLHSLEKAMFTDNYHTTASAIRAIQSGCRLAYSLPKTIRDDYFPPGSMVGLVGSLRRCASNVFLAPDELLAKVLTLLPVDIENDSIGRIANQIIKQIETDDPEIKRFY